MSKKRKKIINKNKNLKKNNLYCTKCDSNNIYPISQIIVSNKNKKSGYEYKKYWFVLRKISDLLKEKILFISFTLDKIKSDLMNLIWVYCYFILIVSILTIIPFSIFISLGNFRVVFALELSIITFIFFIIFFMKNLRYSSYKKKFYNTYCCPHCGRLFIPKIYKVRLKKNTSLLVKIHLVYKKLTREKFYNVRYVSYQVKQEMKKLRMK